MSFFELFLLAVGLSMDAFAVSVCKGLSVGQVKPKHLATAGLYFGGFQALMPLIGYVLGQRFQHLITNVDHWIVFLLLGIIGFNMIKESRECDCQSLNSSMGPKEMLPLAVATSIDALAVGISLAFLQVSIIPAILFIGCTTFVLSAAGVKIGSIFGTRYRSKAELVGGIVLILIGLKILLEHLGIISF